MAFLGIFGCNVYITGMYQVDNSLYEAADIEGATKFQKFRFITLPMITAYFYFYINDHNYLVNSNI